MATPSVRKHGGGQRPLTPGEVSVLIPARVPQKLHSACTTRAQQLGITQSELVRKALAEFLSDLLDDEDAA